MSRKYECERCKRLVGRVVVVDGVHTRWPGESWEPFAACEGCWCEMQPRKVPRLVHGKALAAAFTAPELKTVGGEREGAGRPKEGEQKNQRYRDNLDSSSSRGTNSDYLAARIARDRPDVMDPQQVAFEFSGVV